MALISMHFSLTDKNSFSLCVCVCVCVFFVASCACAFLFWVQSGLVQVVSKVHHRETVLVPNLKLNHLRILLNPKLCFVLNLICFEPSHNLLEQIATGIQAIMQGLCFWHLSGQHIFWWQEGFSSPSKSDCGCALWQSGDFVWMPVLQNSTQS
jgi:hypothetical protein